MSRPSFNNAPFVVLTLLLWATLLPRAQASYTPPNTDRTKTQVSGSWKFTTSNTLLGAEAANYDDSSWSTVTVPHTWDTPSKITLYSNSWYRTHFRVPNSTGKRVYIYFEGAYQVADVYVNGQHLGQHRGGYTRFIYDATSVINFSGDNVLAVTVSSANCSDCLPDGGARLFHPYGGIYRKVWIVTTNRYHVATTDFASSGVYITPANISQSSANLSIKTMVTNDGSVAQTFNVQNVLTDSGGNIVLTLSHDVVVAANTTDNITQIGVVLSPSLWSKSNPYLYRVYTNITVNGLITDSVTEHTGFRFYQLATSFFTLNGNVDRLRGVSKHEETEYHATAVTDQELIEDWDNIQDLGVNFVRLAHNPHAQLEYDLADQKGIMVWCENGHTNFGVPTSNGNYINQEMVYQNWNHPSIIFWSAGNEANTSTASAYGAVIHAADASRPVVYANQGNASPLANIDFAFSNIYPGWYYGSLYDFVANVDHDHWVSESGASGVITIQNSDSFNTSFTVSSYEPEQYMQMVNEVKFQTMFVNKPDAIPVFSNWVFREFGDSKYKGYINSKGFLTFSNYRKDIYYLYKSDLVGSPVVHIVGPHYFLRGSSGSIKVYSNASQISLTVNGILVGTHSNGQYAHPNGMVIDNVFYWSTALQNGRNVVKASDGLGNVDTAVTYFTGSSTAAPPDSGALISNLTSSNGNNRAYFIDAPVHDQWGFYYDFNSNGDNSFDVVPAPLIGANWIATKRQSDATQTTQLSFSVKANADIYVMFTRQSSVPSWITNNFSDTGVTGIWRDNNLRLRNYQLYKASCSAGANVILGSSTIDFIVLVQPGAGGNCKIGATPDFSLSATPSSQAVTVGSATTYTPTVATLNGFKGVVTLGASGLPAGATASFAPATVRGSGSSTLTVTTTGSTPVGTSTLTITGVSGSLTHTVTVSLVVNAQPPPPDFTIARTPTTQTVGAENSTTYTANIGALNGFAGVVTLSASGLPTGATASFAPATVTGSGSSTLTVTTAGSTPAGTSTVTITGVSGSVTHTTTVSLVVTAAGGAGVISIDFVGQETVMGGTEVAGVVAKSNWNNASGQTNTTGQALVDESGTATGATVIWNTNGMWNLPITAAPGNVRMMRGYLDTLGATTTVTVSGLPARSGGYAVYVYADGDNGTAARTGAYQINGTGITKTSVNLTDAANTNFSGTFTQANNSNGNYVKFTVTATGFTITATPGAASDGFHRAPLNGIQIVPQ